MDVLTRTSHFLGQVEPALQPVLQAAINRFRLGDMSDHGPSHWLKVLGNVVVLAAQTPNADLAVCQLFALLHDCERHNEGSDLAHGPRAAAYAEALHTCGTLDISKQQLNLLIEACTDHTSGCTSGDPTIGVCWDGDRLDLPRVGIGIDPSYLSTAAARSFV